MNKSENSGRKTTRKYSKGTVIESLVSGSLSSTFTTVVYQPLELLKTRIQLHHDRSAQVQKILGRTTKSAIRLVRDHNFVYLWRGTGASLVRSVPGVGLYYASLDILQTNLSGQQSKPDNPMQAFCFGLAARSLVSLILIPVTVVKVRYESGQYKYTSLSAAILGAYRGSGWTGVTPTILRDSLFSGIFYMCYTKLKMSSLNTDGRSVWLHNNDETPTKTTHSTNFINGTVSGLIASVATNPIDVLKTKIQADASGRQNMRIIAREILEQKRGYLRLFDGLVPRGLRRTLMAASTWTFYEFFMHFMR